MIKFLICLVAVAILALAGGCKSVDRGSREYVPGQGWQPLPEN